MKILFLIFLGILFFKEFLIINYEFIIIIGFLIVLSFLIKNLLNIFKNFFISSQTNINLELTTKLYKEINRINLQIALEKAIITL